MSNAPATVAEGETDAAAKPPAKKRKLLLFAAVGVIVLLLVVAGLWFGGILHHRRPVHVANVPEGPSFIDIPDVVTNLDTGSRRAVFVKLKSKIEIAHAADRKAVSDAMPQILDSLQTYLRSMRPEELHGGEGTYRLREAMMTRIDAVAAPVQVTDVLFVEMLVQ